MTGRDSHIISRETTLRGAIRWKQTKLKLTVKSLSEEIVEQIDNKMQKHDEDGHDHRKPWRWKPTSEKLLDFAETKMLQGVKRALKVYFAPISRENHLRTIESSNKSDRLPLVLLHGMGGGVGLWVMNIDSLSEKQKVYAIDLLGFGRSSRPKFPKDALEAEKVFVQSLEEWRKMVGLEKFILLGQSFGGYLACSYSISYPDRVKHLILSEPWGMPNPPTEIGDDIKIPRWSKMFLSIFSFFYPFTVFRAVGPLGPLLIDIYRPDWQKRYEKAFGVGDRRIVDYIYHINAQYPSGEKAFRSLSAYSFDRRQYSSYKWAGYPMIKRMEHIHPNVPITVLLGTNSNLPSVSYSVIKPLRMMSYVNFVTIKGAGHNLFADAPSEFNRIVNTVCDVANDTG